MLASARIVAFVGARDPIAAKAFYRDVLGLPLVHQDEFALVFDAGGTMLRVTFVDEIAAARYTVLGWEVPDIAAVVAKLSAAGVQMQRYQGVLQNPEGIWEAPNGALVAWFTDPAGNILSVTQFPKAGHRA